MTTKISPEQRVCVLNVGLFRTGTTTLAIAFNKKGLNSYRWLPNHSRDQFKRILMHPDKIVLEWASSGGFNELVSICKENDYVSDGWCPLLPFLPEVELDRLRKEALDSGIKIELVATTRDINSLVKSELQHWVVHNLEVRSGLSRNEREHLEFYLRNRSLTHERRIDELVRMCVVQRLPLRSINESWPTALSRVCHGAAPTWEQALREAGTENANPRLPIAGILLTLRLGDLSEGGGREAITKTTMVQRLLAQLESDSICQYLVVLAIDADEEHSQQVRTLVETLNTRVDNQLAFKQLEIIVNPKAEKDQPFAICSVWNEMANVAWQHGADWVVLLGDDIEINCPFHYRAVYRKFLDISDQLKVPFGFGCPWWNDETFPNFPTFPCVGKMHYEVFGSLIPHGRHFVNQDLDPYLHRLYSKFWASPCVTDARLSNSIGGEAGSGSARYDRVPQPAWKDFAIEDITVLRKHLPRDTKEAVLVDVVVPSYRVKLDYLTEICSLKVPDYMQTLFIIIIDNPTELIRVADLISQQSKHPKADIATAITSCTTQLEKGERILENYLLAKSGGNTVRVRCNKNNLGASGSRNRGLDESAADFVLNLDDDLIPEPDLLEQYGGVLQRDMLKDDSSVVGLIGLVRFPRSPTLPLRHAAVLMSYLTFMFEIAEQDLYPNPAWGVTANILFRRNPVRFDLAYAKTGGGEDVDYALRVCKALNGGKLVPVPGAKVVHPFWPGSVWTLSSHFFNWAIGDGGLLLRFPEYRYWSFPNLPETCCLAVPLMFLLNSGVGCATSPAMMAIMRLLCWVPLFLLADVVVDGCNRSEFRHRCSLLQKNTRSGERQQNAGEYWERSFLFYLASHVVANGYVVILECGRLYGHLTRQALLKEGFCRRFDWHCGKLPRAPGNFRKREAQKFGCFVAVIVVFEFVLKHVSAA